MNDTTLRRNFSYIFILPLSPSTIAQNVTSAAMCQHIRSNPTPAAAAEGISSILSNVAKLRELPHIPARARK